VLDSLRAALAGRVDVRLALLFGSRARGQGRPDSDADLAVIAPGVHLDALAGALSRAAGVEVDVVSLEDPGYPLLKVINRDGLLLHQAAPGLLGRWRAHAIACLETDRPWFERLRNAYLRKLAAGARVEPAPDELPNASGTHDG
jgi:predicted nucleotidyltransferase